MLSRERLEVLSDQWSGWSTTLNNDSKEVIHTQPKDNYTKKYSTKNS
jgi:hypothetical protein